MASSTSPFDAVLSHCSLQAGHRSIITSPLRIPYFPKGTHYFDPRKHNLIEGVSKCVIPRQEAQAKFNEYRETQGSYD